MTGLLLSQSTQIFKALAHPMRLEILSSLSDQAQSVNDLSRQLKKRQPNVSQHLQVLKKINLVSLKKVGKKHIYTIENKNKALVKYFSKL
jgi:DNA-binding transcriptional ArsR family regulator